MCLGRGYINHQLFPNVRDSWYSYYGKWMGSHGPSSHVFTRLTARCQICRRVVGSERWRKQPGYFRWFVSMMMLYWVVVSNIFHFHPYPLGNVPIWLIFFQMDWNHQLVILFGFVFISPSKMVVWFVEADMKQNIYHVNFVCMVIQHISIRIRADDILWSIQINPVWVVYCVHGVTWWLICVLHMAMHIMSLW